MNEITRIETKLPAPQETPVTKLIELALNSDVSIEKMERLQEMYLREQDRRAKAAFLHAMAEFRAICPPVTKTARGQHVREVGTRVMGMYAPLDDITRTIDPYLSRCGLSYRWSDAVVDKATGMMTICCIVSHEAGHSESASATLPYETGVRRDGERIKGSSPQQQFAAAMTFCRRLSLISALGITTADPDLDGEPTETVTPDQAAEIQDLLDTRVVDHDAFWAWVGCDGVKYIPRDRQAGVVAMLRKKPEKPK